MKLLKTANGGDIYGNIDEFRQWPARCVFTLNLNKCLPLLNEANATFHVDLPVHQAAVERTQQARDLGILMSAKFKPGPQCQKAVIKAWRASNQSRRTVESGTVAVLLPLFRAFARLYFEYCVLRCRPSLASGIKILEQVQCYTRRFGYLRQMRDEQRLGALSLYSLERLSKGGELIQAFEIVKKSLESPIPGNREQCTKRERENKCARTRNHLFEMQIICPLVVNGRNKLPVDVVEVESVREFKRRLDNAGLSVFEKDNI